MTPFHATETNAVLSSIVSNSSVTNLTAPDSAFSQINGASYNFSIRAILLFLKLLYMKILQHVRLWVIPSMNKLLLRLINN